MILQTANGPKEIKVADLDFTNLMCDLEDHRCRCNGTSG